MKKIITPIKDKDLLKLNVGDQISISGIIYTGRDAALPQLVKLIKNNSLDFNLKGAAIMHTAAAKIGRASVGKECRSRWSPYH